MINPTTKKINGGNNHVGITAKRKIASSFFHVGFVCHNSQSVGSE
jgi:hypothetical protein